MDGLCRFHGTFKSLRLLVGSSSKYYCRYHLFSIVIVVSVFDSPNSHYHVILSLLYGFAMLYCFANYIPSIALQVRRLRDAGYHWALIFLRFAFVIGDIVLLVLFCQPTKVEFPFNNFNNLQQ